MARSCTRPARPANRAARYAGELGRPVLGKKKATNSVHRYQNLQDILGEHQDAVVAADLPRRMAAGTAGHPDENGFTYGLLYARELDRALAHTGTARQPPSDTHRPGPGPGSPDTQPGRCSGFPVVRFPGPSQVVEFRRTPTRRTLSVHGIVSHGTGAAVKPSAVRPRCAAAGRVGVAGGGRDRQRPAGVLVRCAGRVDDR